MATWWRNVDKEYGIAYYVVIDGDGSTTFRRNLHEVLATSAELHHFQSDDGRSRLQQLF
jgi:hypothetical protein